MTDSGPARRLHRADATGGAALLALALFALWGAQDLPFGSLARPGPGFFPLSLGTLLGTLSLWILARAARPLGTSRWRLWLDAGSRNRVLILAAALFGYVLIIDTVGFVVATVLMFVVMLRAVAVRGWLVSLLYSLAVASVSWLFFARLLRVNLPAGLLF